ncbi:MAG: ferrous iron transport protein B [Candidatus Bipolaricaulota bacterium]
MRRIALAGQPNCGKSTLFNHWAGTKAHTSNLPGTTVEFLESVALIDGRTVSVVDLPGTYALTSLDEAEVETRKVLLGSSIDVIVNVMDASLLGRGLELTLELLELGRPMVVALNMADEAHRKGVAIDIEALSALLGVPVVSTVARRGTGVRALASAALCAAESAQAPRPIPYGADVERAIAAVAGSLDAAGPPPPGGSKRLASIKLLERDPLFVAWAEAEAPEAIATAEDAGRVLETTRGAERETVISAERHARAMDLAERSSRVGRPIVSWSDRIDGALMHPVLGLPILAAILYGLFVAVFRGGAFVEVPLFGLFEGWSADLDALLGAETAVAAIARGALLGVGGAVGLVLPYLLPFLLGMTLLEDIGYLPRVGYLLDGLMHRVGLHGKSVIPFILGYGCSVPAVMATRILDSRRDRVVTAALAVMVPCVARATVVFGLVGAFLGGGWAFLLFVVNVAVIAGVGRLLTVVWPSASPGLLLEIPSYKTPGLKSVASKVWFRVRDFLQSAVPLLVLGSIAMSLLEFAGADDVLNWIARPFTWTLGLPFALGIPLIFGVFRKELALVLVMQALGTAQVLDLLSRGQIVTLTLFILFYIPCVATVAVLKRELGWRPTAAVLAGTTGLALLVGLAARGLFAL